MTATRDPDGIIHAFLLEGDEVLHDQVYDAVRAEIEHRPQRVVIGPWRMPIVNKIVGVGAAAAAVIAIVFIGAQLLGAPSGGVGEPGDDPTPSPEASVPDATAEPTPSATAWRGIPQGPFVVTGPDDPVEVTIDIAAPGWVGMSQFDAVGKDDDGLDPPDSVGVALLAWAWPAGTGFEVYGDPCQWSTTVPEVAATTPDEIAAALAAQAASEPSAPVDVSVGGFAGKAITVHVPMTYDLPDATREERFADCDQAVFGYYGIEGASEPARNAQGAGQIDELWILDVDGAIVILDAAYAPAAPADLVEELRTLAESATFEVP